MELTASGGSLCTVTAVCTVEDRPSVSKAVTSTVEVPEPRPRMVTRLSDDDAVATCASELTAAKVSGSPSGSSKILDTSTVAESPESSSKPGIESTTTGGRFGTVTMNACAADKPSASVAVTVVVAVPFPAPNTVTVLPDTETVATPVSELSTVKVSVSSSGSSKCWDTSIVAESPTLSSRPGIESTTTGGRFGTVTMNACAADKPSASVAVTVVVAVPFPAPNTVTVLPDTETVATPVSELSTVKVSVSSSGSSKCWDTSIVAESPTLSSRPGIESTTTGGRFGTVTMNACAADKPSASVAVTVVVAVPFPAPNTVTVLPDTETVATPCPNSPPQKSARPRPDLRSVGTRPSWRSLRR